MPIVAVEVDWEVVCALSNGTFLMTLDDCLTAETTFGF